MQEQAAEPKTAVETRQNPKNPLNVNDNSNSNVKENVKMNVEDNEERNSIDYYLRYFCNYHYNFNYNLLLNEKDLFYSKYQYPIDTLRKNIEEGTGNPLSVEGTLNYLLEYVQLAGFLH